MFKLERETFEYLLTEDLTVLIKLFEKYGHEIRIAGGAVRDLLSGKKPTDIDLATTATPTQMKEMFTESGIRMINTNGESHGTITARINDRENFEVTTLRIDVATDGRRAQVEFTKDWQLDANRRDLTINSMFLGFDGTVYDYFDGRSDLDRHLVKFVGNAHDRICEDYLRILRYFRFFGRIAIDPEAHEEGTLRAIKENGAGLKDISGERIWTELRRILVGNFAPHLFDVMQRCGIHVHFGLPSELNISNFRKVYERTQGWEPLPITHLASMLQTEDEIDQILHRLKVSNEELSLLRFVVSERDRFTSGDSDSAVTRYYQGLLAAQSSSMLPKVRARVCQLCVYWGRCAAARELNTWTVPSFPVDGAAVLQAGVARGPHVAGVLQQLKQAWNQSDFQLSRLELIDLIPEALERFKSLPPPTKKSKTKK